jgi:hypothetical protein
MNAQSRRNRRTLGPIITLVCAGIVAFAGLQGTGANAEGVPTPSETTTATSVAQASVDEAPIVVPPTTPTGTTLPVAP